MEFEKIKKVIEDNLSVDTEITLETKFVEDLGADSLDIFQVVSDLEGEFNMEFDNDAAEKIKTVGDVVDYIKSHK